ncbi:MAG: hypoxanthine/guanine phosphoribosyltransferase [Candidatus Hydrothermarchaeota archaeon]
MLEKLKESLKNIPVIKKGEYEYFVHPITDGIPLVEPEVLREASTYIINTVDLNVDKILTIEAMGIHLATTLSLMTDLPLVIVRKRKYGLAGEVAVHQVTGYSKGELYINGVMEGDRILIVDDVISTGGTLTSVISALKQIGAIITDVITVFERGEGVREVKKSTGIDVKTLIRIDVKDGKVTLIE